MSNFTSELLSWVLLYKYVAIYIITFLGAFALPVPSGTVMMAAAAFAVQGYLNAPLTVVIGIIGNITGDNANYWLARRWGVRVFKKIGLGRLVEHEKTHRIRREIERHPFITIFISRFMTAIAPTVNIVAGITELDYWKFLFYEALGECTEVGCFCAIGFIFGSNWQYVDKLGGNAWLLLLLGVIISYIFWNILLKRGDKRG